MRRPWRAGCSRRQRKRRRASCSGYNLRQFALTRRSAVGAAGCFREGGRHTAHSPQPRGVGRDANRLLPGRAGPSLQWSQPGDSPRVHQSAPAPHLRIPRALVRRTCTRAEKRSNKPESHFPASWTHRASRWALGLGLQGRPPSTDSRALASRARAGVGRERGLACELAAGCIYACTLLPGNSQRATPAPPTVPPAHSGRAPSLARALSVGRTPQAVPVIAGVLANNSYAPCFVVANKRKCVADAIIPAPAGGLLALLFAGSKPYPRTDSRQWVRVYLLRYRAQAAETGQACRRDGEGVHGLCASVRRQQGKAVRAHTDAIDPARRDRLQQLPVTQRPRSLSRRRPALSLAWPGIGRV